MPLWTLPDAELTIKIYHHAAKLRLCWFKSGSLQTGEPKAVLLSSEAYGFIWGRRNGMCQSLYLFTDSRGLHAEAHVELIGRND